VLRPGEDIPVTPETLARDFEDAASVGASGVGLCRLGGLAPVHAAVLAGRAVEDAGVTELSFRPAFPPTPRAW
jgi:hypothetical protein